jgi:uncharacterized protein
MKQQPLPLVTLQRCEARDTFALSSRKITPEGFLVAPGTIARAGNVQPYRASEIRNSKGEAVLAGDQNRIVGLYRPPEEVFSPETVASFEAAPITRGHPTDGFVTASNWKDLSVGDCVRVVPVPGENKLNGELHIRAADAVAAVMGADSAPLSCGYSYDLDPTPGISPAGEPYVGVQRKIRGNHIAIAHGRARGGEECRVADSQPPEKERTMSQRRIAVDSVDYDLDEQAASLVTSLVKARDAALSDLASALTQHRQVVAAKDEAIRTATAKAATVQATDADVEALVAEKTAVLAAAAKLAPSLKPTGSAAAIRRAAVSVACADEACKSLANAVLGGVALDKAPDATVRQAFDALCAMPRANAQDAALASLVERGNSSAAAPVGIVVESQKAIGYDAFIERLNNGTAARAAAK